MIQLRDKVLGEFQRLTEKEGLEAVVNYKWANTGTLYAMKGFEVIARCDFDFQSHYTMALFNGAKHGPPGLDNFYVTPTDSVRYAQMFDRWRHLCRGDQP